MISDDDRTIAMVCHLSVLFGWIVLPTVVYLLMKRRSRYVRFHAKNAIFYQVGVLFLLLVSLGTLVFLVPLFMLVGVIWGIRAFRGTWSGYPVISRMIDVGGPEEVE